MVSNFLHLWHPFQYHLHVKLLDIFWFFWCYIAFFIATIILRKCEDEDSLSQPHFEASVRMKFTLPKVGTWSLFGLLKTQSFIVGGQNISHWGVLYIVGKVLKCKCPKWLQMSHLDICNTSYGRKKGRELNW